MDGVHDMGGMHGFGKVEPEPNEPVFHDDWERRLHALHRAMNSTGVWVIDHARFARERLPPAVYLASTYYKRWELGMEKLLAEFGLVGPDELAAGHALRPGKALKRKLTAADVPITRGPFSRPPQAPARFKPGDRVRGCHVFPDTVAIGKGEDPQWLYTVLFDGRELWGEGAEPSLKVSIEAFEPYLEPA